MTDRATIERVRVDVWKFPTQTPEADETCAWDSTTMIAVARGRGGDCGLGYTYGHRAVATVLHDTLVPRVKGCDALEVEALHDRCVAALRNAGYPVSARWRSRRWMAHAAVCVAVEGLRHVEYFHDHGRFQKLAFDGAAALVDGALQPDRSRPGHGLHLREADLEAYRVN